MRATAGVGVVADEGVADGDCLIRAEPRQHRFHDAHQRAEVDWDVFGLRQGTALGVEEGGGAIAPLLDVGG